MRARGTVPSRAHWIVEVEQWRVKNSYVRLGLSTSTKMPKWQGDLVARISRQIIGCDKR